jgi:hypothetical protein
MNEFWKGEMKTKLKFESVFTVGRVTRGEVVPQG